MRLMNLLNVNVKYEVKYTRLLNEYYKQDQLISHQMSKSWT